MKKLPQTYACRRCGRTYSFEDYEESRFCRDCGTYLTPESKVSGFLKKIGKVMKRKVRGKTPEEKWLPEGYEVRKGQMEFIKDASKAIKNNGIFLGSAPCGIGKSLASLLAVLPQLEENKLMITFRTRNQLDIYLKELKGLSCNLLTVSLFSKQTMCPMRIGGTLSYVDFFEECRRLKDNCESLTKPYCRFYLRNLKKKKRAEELALNCAQKILAPMESVRLMTRQGYCAYEALRKILNKVNIFLGTYHYVFDPQIRRIILKELGLNLDKVYLIVDEAHNIPAFARELLSDKLTETTLERALKETEKFKHESLSLVREHLELLDERVFTHAQRILKKQKLKRLEPQQIDDLFLSYSGVAALEAAEVLLEYGEYVKEKRRELGHKRLLSYNYRVGRFLESFFTKLGEKYIHLIRKDRRDGIVLEVRNFDGREITDHVLRQTCGSILMSGSLSPPRVYRDLMLCDHNGVHFKEYDSPFPAENRLILAGNDVSSRFKKRTSRMLKKWKEYVEAVSNANMGNIAFFFTSYELMQIVLQQLEMNRNVIVEQRKTRRSNVIRQLARSPNNALFGVMGGKFSEGIDYPNNLLTCVVAMGLPYATWNVYQKALIDYYDHQFPGSGEIYAYLTPAILRLVQTAGRVHRSPEDKGCIVILDERITQPNIKHQLPIYFQKEMKIVRSPLVCSRHIEKFWSEHSHSHIGAKL